MAVVYTHDMEIIIGDENVNGELEFNVDGQASYSLVEPFANLTLEQDIAFTNFLKQLKVIFDQFGSIGKIEITEK